MTDEEAQLEMKKPEVQAHWDRYKAAMHAVQTGVALDIQNGDKGSTPKYLRVGVNSALIETSVLCRILVDAGVVTWLDFYRRLADQAEKEKMGLEAKYGIRLG